MGGSMRTAPRHRQPTARRVPGDGVSLHARDWGGAGAPVVLLHGLASNARIWDGVAPRLVAAGLRVVALDQRGHGDSAQPDGGYDFATVGRDLAAACAALGLERPLLAGHSWGADVALRFAADRPGAVAGLALVDGGLVALRDRAGPDLAVARRRLAPPRLSVPLARWLARADRFPPAEREWVREFLRAGVVVDDQGVARARFAFDHHMQVVDALLAERPEALHPRLGCPVLLCPAAGGRAPAARALAALPAGRVAWFDDSGHDIPLEQPERLAAELAAFALGAAGG
jgi:pimeloyl-ACP methyl ester carboxylesterase